MEITAENIRKQFPVLYQEVYGKPYVYLDNAATTQKPLSVINSISDFYKNYNSNVHRGVHYLSQKSTELFEDTRGRVQKFINAPKREEVIFTRGTTDSINLVAHSFGKAFLNPGDEILITAMEHHSNMVPWRMVAEEKNVTVRIVPFLESGELDMNAYRQMLNEKTRIVALGHVSNALGTIHPVKEMIDTAHQKNIPVLIDGAQAVPHMQVDVQDLDCDFYCFSAHKMYGPTGVGVLYGKKEWMEKLPPYQGGGEMIDSVTLEEITFNELPYKFEAGTPNVADIVAFGEAVRFLEDVGFETLAGHENFLLESCEEKLNQIPDIHIYGQAPEKSGVVSFLVGDIHPYDMGTLIDKMGIAVRTGHHCAQPVMEFYRIPGTLRASVGIYNSVEDIDRFVEAVKKAKQMLS